MGGETSGHEGRKRLRSITQQRAARQAASTAAVITAAGGAAAVLRAQSIAMHGGGTAANPQQCNIIAEYGAHPTECTKGVDEIKNTELLSGVPYFAYMMTQQAQILPNHCCMGTNHMFALWSLVRHLQPAAIIESGVAAGHQTWMLRMSSIPYTPIFSVDPGDPATNYPGGFTFKGYKDPSGWTRYFTDANFKDFAEIDWGTVIPDPKMRAKTLVILDDHQSCLSRFQVMQKWGFRWAFYEDNYPFKVATSSDKFTCMNLGSMLARDFPFDTHLYGDAYSPNALCGAKLPYGTAAVLAKDKFGHECSVLTPQAHEANTVKLNGMMDTYYEFPALFTDCPSKRRPLLGSDPSVLASFPGLPPVWGDIWQYGHLFPAFVSLKLLR